MPPKKVPASEPENIFVVEEIIGKRRVGKQVQYRIRWKDYPNPEDDTWEPAKNCDCPELIARFENSFAEQKKKRKSAPKATVTAEASSVNVEMADESNNSSAIAPAVTKSDTSEEINPDVSTPYRKMLKLRKDNEPQHSTSNLTVCTVESSSNQNVIVPLSDNEFRDSSLCDETLTELKENTNGWVNTPLADIPELPFVATEILGMYVDKKQLKFVTRTNSGEVELADVKALVKQNIDLAIDYIMSHADINGTSN